MKVSGKVKSALKCELFSWLHFNTALPPGILQVAVPWEGVESSGLTVGWTPFNLCVLVD